MDRIIHVSGSEFQIERLMKRVVGVLISRENYADADKTLHSWCKMFYRDVPTFKAACERHHITIHAGADYGQGLRREVARGPHRSVKRPYEKRSLRAA